MKVFISYSHKDAGFKEEFDEHLAALKRTGLVTTWHDGMIPAGSNFDKMIREELDSSQLIVLLVSSSFINSDYAYGIEMARALQMHDMGKALVIPVIIRSCDWKGTPIDAKKLKVLPRDGRPVADKKWTRDLAYTNVVEGIREAISQWRPQRAYVSEPPPHVHTIPDDLIRALDRVPQASLAQTVVRREPAPARPYVFLLHGASDESPLQFRRRLENIEIPTALTGSSDAGNVRSCRFMLPPPYGTQQEFNQEMWRLIGQAAFRKGTMTSDEIMDAVGRSGEPILLWSELSSGDWRTEGRRLVDNFLTFWNALPPVPPKRLFAVLVVIHPHEECDAEKFLEEYRGDNVGRAYVTADGTELGNLTLIGLPVLEPIESYEVESWLEDQNAFTGFCPVHERFCDIDRALYELSTVIFAENTSLSMYRLAPRLKELLTKYSCERRMA